MSGLDEFEGVLLVNQGLDRAQLRGERGLRVHEVEFGDGLRRQLYRVKLGAQLFGEREEYARDFALFRFAQGLEFVVRLDGLQRLDEDCRARGREAVRDARDAAAVVAADGDDEAVVADA